MLQRSIVRSVRFSSRFSKVENFSTNCSPLLKRSSRLQVQPFREIHPIVWFIARPALKLTAMLTGRGFRKYWIKLDSDEKAKFKSKYRLPVFGTLFASLAVLGAYLYAHVSKAPFTGRWRIMLLTAKDLEFVTDETVRALADKHRNEVLPASDPLYKMIEKIANVIISANRDIVRVREINWTLSVINSDFMNVEVMPNGHIVFYTGMLNAVSNVDQIASVISHEMAHTLLDHVLVAGSKYSQMLELEADRVGTVLLAKACFDVRESSALWEMFALKDELLQNSSNHFLSTHPTHKRRAREISGYCAEANELRTALKCPPLSDCDPIGSVKTIREKILSLQHSGQLPFEIKEVVVLPDTTVPGKKRIKLTT